MKHEGVDARHSPGMLRGSRTMSCPPGGHTAIVDGTESADRHVSRLGNLGECLDTRVLGMEPRGIGRLACLDALICLPGGIGFRILPGHLDPAGGIALALCVLTTRQATMVLYRPIHCVLIRQYDARREVNRRRFRRMCL